MNVVYSLVPATLCCHLCQPVWCPSSPCSLLLPSTSSVKALMAQGHYRPHPPHVLTVEPCSPLADPAQLTLLMCTHQARRWLQAEGAGRDVLLLDIALDNYFRLCIERTDKSSLSGDDLLEMVGLVLSNACIAGESQDFGQVCLIHSFPSHVLPDCFYLYWTRAKR